MLLNLSLNFSSKMRQLLILMPTSWRKLTTQSLSLTSTAWSLSREPRATLSAPDYSAPRRGCSVPAAGRMRPPGVSEAPVCRCPHGGAGPRVSRASLCGLDHAAHTPRSRPTVPALRSGGSELVPVRETPRDHRARPSFLPRAPPAAAAPVRSLSRADSRAGSPLRGGSSTTKWDLPVEKTFPGVPKKTSIQLKKLQPWLLFKPGTFTVDRTEKRTGPVLPVPEVETGTSCQHGPVRSRHVCRKRCFGDV